MPKVESNFSKEDYEEIKRYVEAKGISIYRLVKDAVLEKLSESELLPEAEAVNPPVSLPEELQDEGQGEETPPPEEALLTHEEDVEEAEGGSHDALFAEDEERGVIWTEADRERLREQDPAGVVKRQLPPEIESPKLTDEDLALKEELEAAFRKKEARQGRLDE